MQATLLHCLQILFLRQYHMHSVRFHLQLLFHLLKIQAILLRYLYIPFLQQDHMRFDRFHPQLQYHLFRPLKIQATLLRYQYNPFQRQDHMHFVRQNHLRRLRHQRRLLRLFRQRPDLLLDQLKKPAILQLCPKMHLFL